MVSTRQYSAIATALVLAAGVQAAPTGQPWLVPYAADISHASADAVSFFNGYFAAKTAHDGDELINYFNPIQAEYFDTTIGLTIGANRSSLVKNIDGLTASWVKMNSTGQSYPLRILGNRNQGAIVYLLDTPSLFGAEIRSLSTFDFDNGTITRQTDTWDGRGNAFKQTAKGDAQYPNLGLPGLQEKAADEMKTVADQISDALSTGNATAAAALFSYNAVWEDLTLRTRVEGQISIAAYLQRAVSSLPNGVGVELTHIVGSAVGGGYEWRPTTGNVRYGVTALELDESGSITQFTTVWDGSRLNQTAIEALADLAPSP